VLAGGIKEDEEKRKKLYEVKPRDEGGLIEKISAVSRNFCY
jgi:hypothetical protein